MTTEKKNGATAEDATGAKPEVKPELSKAEKTTLFVAYDVAHAAVLKAEAALEKAQGVRSAAVKAIRHACGAGPFHWQGKEMVAMSRGDAFFFRGANREVEKIG